MPQLNTAVAAAARPEDARFKKENGGTRDSPLPSSPEPNISAYHGSQRRERHNA
ncbi:hypothetical protein APED_29905 [Acanthopleuribacter pedis]